MSISIKQMEDEQNRKSRPYKFVLVGATAIGKTCILAQLAMNRDGDERYSSTLTSWDREKLSEKDVKRAATDWEAKKKLNYQNGVKMLREATESIREGNAPKATPPGITVRLMADFEMGDSERGTFYVSTEDYSGENINASEDALSNHQSESYALLKRMTECDGLILVVDTLLEGEDTQSAERMVQSLSAFFTAVKKNSKVDWENFPIALIFSKWDKLGPIDFQNPGAEFEKLESHRKESFVQFYNELIASLRNATENQEHIENDDNFRVFPVSAFGRTRKEGGHDVPEIGTRAFGIVAPFVWLANRCDELNMVSIRKEAEKLHQGWKKWFCPQKKLAKKVKGRSIFLQNRIAKSKNHEQELKEIQKRAHAAGWHAIGIRSALWIILLYAAIFLLCLYLSYRWQAVLDDPKTTSAQLLDLKANVDTGAQLTAPLPLVNQRFYNVLNDIDQRLEELLWIPVEQASGPREKAIKAQEYLDKHPNGKRKSDAEAIISIYRAQLDDEAWKPVTDAKTPEEKYNCAKHYLEFVSKKEIPGEHKVDAERIVQVEYPTYLDNQKWEFVVNLPDSKMQIDAAKDYLRDFPNGLHRKDAEALIQNGTTEIKWIQDCAKYSASRDMTDLERNFINLLTNYGIDKVKTIVEAFPNVLLTRLDTENSGSDRVDQIANCERAIKILENIESTVRSQSPDFGKDYTTAQAQLETKRKGIIDDYDNELYANTKNSIQHCNTYLNAMKPYGGGAMMAEVDRMKQYFESLKKTCDFDCKRSTVSWGNAITNHNARMEIRINGEMRHSTPIGHNDGRTENVGDFSFKGIPENSVTIDIKVISERNTLYANNKELHSGTKTIPLREWAKSGSVTLEIGKNSRVTLYLSNYPKQPEFQTKEKKEKK